MLFYFTVFDNAKIEEKSNNEFYYKYRIFLSIRVFCIVFVIANTSKIVESYACILKNQHQLFIGNKLA